MREAQFSTEVTRSLKAAGAWAWKIPDQPVSWTFRHTRFAAEKPCDILFCYRSKFGAIESKQMKKFEAFGLRHMRDSQIRNLDEISERGGIAYVFLNVRIARKENRLIALDWKVWKAQLEIMSLSGKEVAALPHIKGTGDRFPLSDWLYRCCVRY
jgi:hypothetical protein